MYREYCSDVAKDYGIPVTVMLCYFWHSQEEESWHKESQFYGRTWFPVRGMEAMQQMFPEFSKTVIKSSLTKMRNEGLLLIGDFTVPGYEDFTWYSLTDNGIRMAGGKA